MLENAQTLNNFQRELSQQEGIFQSALLPANQGKNRYINVLPNEPTRVRLEPLPDEPNNSDFINANWIRGADIDKALGHQDYIATQAPIQGWTFCEFWRMVWENKVPVIVMLTSLRERGSVRSCSHPFIPTPSKISIRGSRQSAADARSYNDVGQGGSVLA